MTRICYEFRNQWIIKVMSENVETNVGPYLDEFLAKRDAEYIRRKTATEDNPCCCSVVQLTFLTDWNG